MGNSKNLPAAVPAAELEPVRELTAEIILALLKRLFAALQEATGDAATAALVIEKLAEGVEADPEFSKIILTPENIAKGLMLKKKVDAGTAKLTDVTEAFPGLEEKFPFIGMLDKIPFLNF